MKFRHNYSDPSGILPFGIHLKVIPYSEFLLIINFGALSNVIYLKAKSSYLAGVTAGTVEDN